MKIKTEIPILSYLKNTGLSKWQILGITLVAIVIYALSIGVLALLTAIGLSMLNLTTFGWNTLGGTYLMWLSIVLYTLAKKKNNG